LWFAGCCAGFSRQTSTVSAGCTAANTATTRGIVVVLCSRSGIHGIDNAAGANTRLHDFSGVHTASMCHPGAERNSDKPANVFSKFAIGAFAPSCHLAAVVSVVISYNIEYCGRPY
jgi:hypothetical protein